MIDINPSNPCRNCGEPALIDMSTNVKRRFECSLCDAVYVGQEQTTHL